MRAEKAHEPVHDHFGGIFACHDQYILAAELGLRELFHARYFSRAAQQGGDFLLDEFGLTFFYHQHRGFARAEFGDFLGTSG